MFAAQIGGLVRGGEGIDPVGIDPAWQQAEVSAVAKRLEDPARRVGGENDAGGQPKGVLNHREETGSNIQFKEATDG
ncbi:hypothetical protein D3C83_155440 [compost metagenome]